MNLILLELLEFLLLSHLARVFHDTQSCQLFNELVAHDATGSELGRGRRETLFGLTAKGRVFNRAVDKEGHVFT